VSKCARLFKPAKNQFTTFLQITNLQALLAQPPGECLTFQGWAHISRHSDPFLKLLVEVIVATEEYQFRLETKHLS
jgi:hypothetical protein